MRLGISLLSGLLVSLVLFWFMQFMISNNQQAFEKTDSLQMTEFVRLKREAQLKTKERKMPEEPPPEKRPPPPPQVEMRQSQVTQTELPDMDMPNLDIPLQSSRFAGSVVGGVKMGKGKISSNVIPLVRIPPRYPMRAARRRIEGWVKVEFTITESGTVKDAVVVDSQPGNIFDQAALRAISKWKFKAKIIDGEAFEQRAVQVLQFKLSK
ncbi:energy transducer TonB [Methylomarinum sp. Ch1-1]|uniref:Protein TonB n=1 Tax=Methylomarinum roseum TaxID=3067653 RepID=A0AAU7NWB2_9GAMM|nr:energy transducer TonB [Methylomarinum sp. Ch1-1]MDP4522698.1 energy transducer TonB [Methylomarinum sp. Ch1-1]